MVGETMIYTLTQPVSALTQPVSALTQQVSALTQPVSPGMRLTYSPGDSPPMLSPMVSGTSAANSLQTIPPMTVAQSGAPAIPGTVPGVGLPGVGLQPGIMHLINYGDKDLGLLLSQRMELVWHGEFDRLFSQYFPHMWYLVPTFQPPNDRWRTFKDSAKVRFSCQTCGHGWTSMKGRVIFWFQLNYVTNTGYVMFKLYGQQCQRCKNGIFEHAMWYPEEVVKVLGNVYNRVGQIYYGFVRPPLRIDRRAGKPRNQHNAELCQACKEGLCREEWSFS